MAEYCENCGSELPLREEISSFLDKEPQNGFDRGVRGIDKFSFNIVKSGFTEETYRIRYPDDRDFIIAQRSALNRLGLYAFFGVIFIVIVLWGITNVFIDSPDFSEAFVIYLMTGIIQIFLALIIMVIINTLVDVRRITVYNEDESIIGAIRGNLFFTRWRVSETSEVNNARFRFGLFRSKGEMKTSFGSFTLNVTEETTLVTDRNGELSFSVHSLDSIYVRRRFRIDSNGQLNPLLICLASICIIERIFRPKTEPD